MGTVMALLAQEGRARFEQRRNIGAVRGVAVGAVLGHRLVLEQEGAAFFRMALVAGLGHGVFLEQLGATGAVRVVAVRAAHFAFCNRVVRGFFAISALVFVAGIADLGLGFPVLQLVFGAVHDVAVIAGYAGALVLGAVPQIALAALMAAQALAGAVLVAGGGVHAFFEHMVRRRAGFAGGTAL